jgi:hypothetical protein
MFYLFDGLIDAYLLLSAHLKRKHIKNDEDAFGNLGTGFVNTITYPKKDFNSPRRLFCSRLYGRN